MDVFHDFLYECGLINENSSMVVRKNAFKQKMRTFRHAFSFHFLVTSAYFEFSSTSPCMKSAQPSAPASFAKATPCFQCATALSISPLDSDMRPFK